MAGGIITTVTIAVATGIIIEPPPGFRGRAADGFETPLPEPKQIRDAVPVQIGHSRQAKLWQDMA